MTKYILNSAVITSPGLYRYTLITKKEVQKFLKEGDIINTIGYEETVELFNEMFNTNFSVNKIKIRMEKGDRGVVFRIKERIIDKEKGKVSKEFIRDKLEIGLLVKLE